MTPRSRENAPSYLVLANRNAGDADASAIREGADRLAESAPTALRWTSSREEVATVVADAPPETVFVAAGGDGTIHGLVDTLHERGRLDRPVGLLPVGTGNDLARNAGLDDDPVAAASAILTGASRRLPLVARDGDVIVNCAHVGLGVEGAEKAAGLKDRLGAVAYPVGTLMAILTCRDTEIALTLDGQEVVAGPCTAVAIVVSGVGVGGGHPVMPASEFTPSTDAVSVVIVRAPARRTRLGIPILVARDRLPREMTVLHGVRLEWRHDGPLRVDVDGQLGTWPASGSVSVVGSWRLLGAPPIAAP